MPRARQGSGLQLPGRSGLLRARAACLRSKLLYHNNGDGTFTDVTQAAGISKASRATV